MASNITKIVCALEATGLLKTPVERRYSVHPFHANRESSGRFLNFYNDIRKYEIKFFDYYRMSINSFNFTFYQKTNFPNCVGSIDGKHIRCTNPKNSGSKYFNYKKFSSVVLMAIADANLCFTTIDVGAYGKEGDSSVFRDSPLGKKLYSGQLNLPAPRCLPNTNTNPQPFVFVGDEAFKLHTNLLRPFPLRRLNPRRRVYNYRLSRCRRSVECAFGVLANKWRVFHTPILVQPGFIDDIFNILSQQMKCNSKLLFHK